MQDLVIFGAGGHAKVVVDTVVTEAKYRIIGLIDDAPSEGDLLGFPVFKNISECNGEPASFIVAIGDNAIRKKKFEELIALGWQPATVIHPSAVVSEFARIGAGSLVCLKASVNTDASIGENVIVNSGANVEHECVIGSHAHVSTGVNLAGRTKVGDGAFIGISSCTIPGIRIGEWALIGAGSSVIRDVEPFGRVAGVPAKPIKSGAKVI